MSEDAALTRRDPPAASRARVLASMILDLRMQRFAAEAEREANGLSADDQRPGAPAGRTFTDDFTDIDAAETRIAERYADLMPQVDALLADDEQPAP